MLEDDWSMESYKVVNLQNYYIILDKERGIASFGWNESYGDERPFRLVRGYIRMDYDIKYIKEVVFGIRFTNDLINVMIRLVVDEIYDMELDMDDMEWIDYILQNTVDLILDEMGRTFSVSRLENGLYFFEHYEVKAFVDENDLIWEDKR